MRTIVAAVYQANAYTPVPGEEQEQDAQTQNKGWRSFY